MKTIFKPANILFYVLSAIVCFILGMIVAGVTGAGEGQGLAGGAIVFMYGIMIGILAIIVSVVAVHFLKETRVVLINKVLAVVSIILVVLVFYRYQTRKTTSGETYRTETELAGSLTSVSGGQPKNRMQKLQPMELGMAVPDFYEYSVSYFYGNPNLEKPVSDHAPTDSLVFKRSDTGVEITYAPPWFVPAHLKMDYEILMLRMLSVLPEFIEVVVNESNGLTAYMDRHRNRLRYWPEFLLSVIRVEPLNAQNNPVRSKPLSHAGLVSEEYSFLRPLRINSQWIQVELLDDSYTSRGKGWIKWRENGDMLIAYSMLS